MSEQPNHAELFAALAKAQADARSVEKDKQNSFHRYKYASAEAVIEESKAAMAAHGLAFFAVCYRFEAGECGAAVGRLHAEYRLVHSTGQSVGVHSSTPVVPEKGRPVDKAEAAAKTADLSYVLRALLMLPRGDEHSIDARDDRDYEPRGRAPQTREEPREPAPTQDDRATYEALEKEEMRKLGEAVSRQELEGIAERIARGGYPPDALRRLRTAWVARRDALGGEQAA